MSHLRHFLNRRHRAQDGDSGLTIIELVVAMSIFSIVLAIYFSALISMSHTTVRAQNTVDAADALRATFNSMDHQVRYASSINRPGKGASGTWYVEFESTNLPENQPAMCYQWRYNPTTKIAAYRTWSQGGTNVVTDWHAVSWDVVSSTGGSPFAFTGALGAVQRQSLTVSMRVDGPASEVLADQQTTFVARNSSYKSTSNPDVNNDGASDTPVCSPKMDRP